MGAVRFPRPSAFHAGVAAILAAALALRLVGLDKGIWLDEYATLRVCQADGGLGWTREYLAYNHPPLYPLLVTIWSQVSLSVPFLRLLSVLLGVATVWIGMAWLRRSSKWEALTIGLLLALAPVLIHYSQELRPYPLLVLVTLLSFSAASRAAERPDDRRAWVALAISLGAVVLTHFIGVAMVPAVAVFLLLSMGDPRSIAKRGPVLALVLPLAAGAALQIAQGRWIGRFTGEWWMPSPSPGLVWRTALRLAGVPLVTPDTGHALAAAAPLVMVGAALLLVAVTLPRGDWRRGLPWLAAAVTYWGVLMLYSAAVMPVVWKNTALPGLVPFLGFMAVQAGSVRPVRLRIVTVLAIGLAGATGAAAWLATEAGRPVESWQQMALGVGSRWQPGDTVIVWPNYAEGPFRFYFRGLPDNAMVAVRPDDQIAATVARLDAVLADAEEHPPRSRLFIVARVDVVTGGHGPTFDHLMAAVRERADRFAEIETLAITADSSILPELQALAARMSASIDAAFGPPVQVDNRAAYERRVYR